MRAFSLSFTNSIYPFRSIRLSSLNEAKVVDIQWNPTIDQTLVACCSDGTVTVIDVDINDSARYSIVGSTTLKDTPTCGIIRLILLLHIYSVIYS